MKQAWPPTRGAVTVVVALVALAAVGLGDPDGYAYVVGYLLVGIGATVAAWRGARSAPPAHRVPYRLIAGGVIAYFLGDIAFYLTFRTMGTAPHTSVADLFWVVSYLLLSVAVFVTLFHNSRDARRIDLDAVLDVLTVLTVSVLVLWVYAIESIVEDSSVSVFVRVVWAGYAIWDAILLALVLRAMASPRSRQVLGPWFGVGAASWLASDIVFLALSESRTASSLSVLGWLAGLALMSTATTRRPVLDRVPRVDADSSETPYLGRLAIAVLPLLVPTVIGAQHETHGDHPGPDPELVSMVVLIALTLTRTALLLQSERHARAQVRRSQRHYARLADTGSDAVLVLDAAGRARESSSLVGRLLAHEDGGLEDWKGLLAPGHRETLRGAFLEALAQPAQVVRAEVRLRPGEGRPGWLSCRVVNLLTDPDVEGVVVSLSDITDRKQAELELQAARDAALAGSRAKSDFLATMSHEIRTPMNGVIGLTHLLLSSELDDRQREHAEGVRTAGETLLTVINDILDFSKIEADRLELESIPLDVAQVVEESAGMVAETAERKGLELVTWLAPDLPDTLCGDPSRLRQVLLNLAANAVKFTAAGEVLVRAGLSGSDADGRTVVRFEVTDTGIGIAEADQERLFQAFSQADSSTTRRYGGTGLGLAIARRLVAAMGGELGVRSVPGVGSTFWFTVPLGAGTRSIRAVPAVDGLAGRRALVVDDNATSRAVLEERLASWGVDTDLAADGDAALLLLRAADAAGTPYDLAVVDLLMPGTDGLDLAARIARTSAEDPAGPRPAVVLLTPRAGISPASARAAGVSARVTKPLRLQELRACLTDVAGGPAAGRRSGRARTAPPGGPSRGHVLIVEDSEINQLVATGMLRQLGYSTEVAENGLEALTAFAQGRYAAILMDCQMPELDGYEATAEIREREARTGLPRTPVIAMTAGAVQGDRERCLAAGMDDYVSKPVMPAELGAALERAVHSTRGARADGLTG